MKSKGLLIDYYDNLKRREDSMADVLKRMDESKCDVLERMDDSMCDVLRRMNDSRCDFVPEWSPLGIILSLKNEVGITPEVTDSLEEQ